MGQAPDCSLRIVRGVLFDFDGTLTRPGGIDFPKIKRAIGCPLETPILEFIDQIPENQKAAAMQEVERIEHAFALQAIPNEGAEETLCMLRRKNIPYGILTRNARSSLLLSLRRFERITPDFFRVIICREDARPKPDPDGVAQAARAMRIPVKSLLMVGDFKFDMMAGRSAGAITALLSDPNREIPVENSEFADMVLYRLTDLFSNGRFILQPSSKE